jgi:Rps23 Pro-64 3,4-dihydroxylase Tpa1-like proline 4-hydroxylase
MSTEWQLRSPIALSELDALADKYRDAYNAADPWPHLVLDDLVDPAFVAAAEAQELDRAMGLEVYEDKTMVKAESAEVSGDAAKAILDSLLSPEFTAFLERLTGIADLIGDPSHVRAGLHVNKVGAFHALHRDFRRHPITQLFNRINVIVFLNSDWKQEYGGELELWPANRSACAQRIRPDAGTVVIFESTATSYHAIPEPVACPPERARLSLATRYYTEKPGPHDRKDMKIFVLRRPQDPLRIDFDKFKGIGTMLWNRLRSH